MGSAILLGFLLASFFFLRFWRTTGDRLFAWFGAAFLVLAGERAVLLWVKSVDEQHPGSYVARLAACLLILAALFDRNRKR